MNICCSHQPGFCSDKLVRNHVIDPIAQVFPNQCQQSRARGTERVDKNEGIEDGTTDSPLYDRTHHLIVHGTGTNTARVSIKVKFWYQIKISTG